jgi:hypothetical protein
VEVRLAHEQGLIHQRELNHFQNWALLYWVYLDRRTYNESLRSELEVQTFNLFPDRWIEVYKGRPDSVLTPAPTESDEIPVDDIDLIHSWYESHEQQRLMNGAGEIRPTGPETPKWGEWS